MEMIKNKKSNLLILREGGIGDNFITFSIIPYLKEKYNKIIFVTLDKYIEAEQKLLSDIEFISIPYKNHIKHEEIINKYKNKGYEIKDISWYYENYIPQNTNRHDQIFELFNLSYIKDKKTYLKLPQEDYITYKNQYKKDNKPLVIFNYKASNIYRTLLPKIKQNILYFLSNQDINFIVTDDINISYYEYICLIAISDLVIGCDSSAIHIAGAFDIPFISIFHNIYPDSRIRYYKNYKSLMPNKEFVPCFPCYESPYCSKIKNFNLCKNNINYNKIYDYFEELIKIKYPNFIVNNEVVLKNSTTVLKNNINKYKYYIPNNMKIGDTVIISGHIKRIYENNNNQKLNIYFHKNNIHINILENNPYCNLYTHDDDYVVTLKEKRLYPQVMGNYIDHVGNKPKLFLTDKEIQWAKKQINKYNIKNLPVLAIHTDGETQGNLIWNIKNYQKIVDNLKDNFFIIQIGYAKEYFKTGNKFDNKTLKNVCQELRYYNKNCGFPNWENEKISRMMMSIISQCDFYLGLNTGSCHIATAFNKPVISINSKSKYPSEKMWDYSFNCNLYIEETNSKDVIKLINNWLKSRKLPKNDNRNYIIHPEYKYLNFPKNYIKKEIKPFNGHFNNIVNRFSGRLNFNYGCEGRIISELIYDILNNKIKNNYYVNKLNIELNNKYSDREYFRTHNAEYRVIIEYGHYLMKELFKDINIEDLYDYKQ